MNVDDDTPKMIIDERQTQLVNDRVNRNTDRLHLDVTKQNAEFMKES